MHFNKYYARLFALIFGLFILRAIYTNSLYLGFILLNIALAFVPYLCSMFLLKCKPVWHFKTIAILLVWLAFLPNAPYLCTDLFHLHEFDSTPLYYDLVYLLLASFIGLLFYFHSVYNVKNWLQMFLPKVKVQILIAFIFIVTAMGIYYGRYLRLNSWELLSQPTYIISNVFAAFFTINFYIVSMLYSIFIAAIFYAIEVLKHNIKLHYAAKNNL